MTEQTPTDLVSVALAAKQFSKPGNEIRVQKLHKAIRDGDIQEHVDPRTQKRVVSLAEVKAFLEGAGSSTRGRPKGSIKIPERVVREGDFVIRATVRETIRSVDVVTSTQDEFFSFRGVVDCEPDQWTSMMKNGTAKELMARDRMFILDRWAFLKLLEQSFEATGESDIASAIKEVAAAYKERSDIHRQELVANDRAEWERKRNGWLIDQGFIDDPNATFDEDEDIE